MTKMPCRISDQKSGFTDPADAPDAEYMDYYVQFETEENGILEVIVNESSKEYAIQKACDEAGFVNGYNRDYIKVYDEWGDKQ